MITKKQKLTFIDLHGEKKQIYFAVEPPATFSETHTATEVALWKAEQLMSATLTATKRNGGTKLEVEPWIYEYDDTPALIRRTMNGVSQTLHGSEWPPYWVWIDEERP